MVVVVEDRIHPLSAPVPANFHKADTLRKARTRLSFKGNADQACGRAHSTWDFKRVTSHISASRVTNDQWQATPTTRASERNFTVVRGTKTETRPPTFVACSYSNRNVDKTAILLNF